MQMRHSAATFEPATGLENRLAILMIAPQFRPIIGGYERAAEALSKALIAQGHRLTVVAERRERSWSANEHFQGMEICRLWCIHRRRLHQLTSLVSFAVFMLLRGRQFDVWHVHQYGWHTTVALLLGRLLGRPVVLKLMNTGQEGIAQLTRNSVFPKLLRALLLRVNAIVALTRESYAEALQFGYHQSVVHLLGNGVDTTEFKPRDQSHRLLIKAQLGLVNSGTVLFVGRLAEQKNVQGLLGAWKNASSRIPGSWQLALVGDGPLQSSLAEQVRGDGTVASVIFAGQQARVQDWMAAADIFVLSSRWEGLSNTTLEAMASGVPVVTTSVSGAAETVGESGAGIVVAIDDMAALADALVALAADSARRAAMASAGRAMIMQRYSIEAVARAHVAMYRQVIGVTRFAARETPKEHKAS